MQLGSGVVDLLSGLPAWQGFLVLVGSGVALALVIRTRDDIPVTVPNSELNSAAIVNESTPRRKRRIRVPVGVAYGTDIDKVEEILLELAEAEDLVQERPNPRVRFREFGDSALNFELLCWVSNPALTARATHELNSAI